MSVPGALTCTLRQRALRVGVLTLMVLVALAAASFSPAAAGRHRMSSPQAAFLIVADDDGAPGRDHHHGSHLSPGLPGAEGLELVPALTPNRVLRPRPPTCTRPTGIGWPPTAPRARELSQPGVLRV